MKTKQINKHFETLIWKMQQPTYCMDQLIKKYEKTKKNNTPKESTDWNDFWKNLKERSNGKIQKPVLA